MSTWKKVLVQGDAVGSADNLNISAVDSGDNVNLRLSDGTNDDDVLITAGANVVINSVTAGGFTIAATDTNTQRAVKATNSDASLIGALGAGETLDLREGSNITITETDGVVTFAAANDAVRTVKTTNSAGVVQSTLEASEDLDIREGSNISLTEAGGTIIIAATDTNTMGSGFTVSATTDTTATTITQGDDLFFAAGAGITCETTADGTVTIASTITQASDVDVNTTNLRARLAQLDNSSTIVIGDAADTTVKIAGNLQVTGTTETVNTTELKVEDITIAVASGSTASSDANNAGLEIDIDADSNYDSNPAILFQDSHTAFSQFKMRKGVDGESDAFIAAMTTAADTSALDALTPGIGTFGMVGGSLYLQTA